MHALTAAGVVFVDDVAKLSAFYQGVAGMRVLHADGVHEVLAAEGFVLTIHALPAGTRQPGRAYPTREETYIKLCFPVDSLARARADAARLGGELWPAAKEWAALGFRACDGRDPEGNVFQAREQARDAD